MFARFCNKFGVAWDDMEIANQPIPEGITHSSEATAFLRRFAGHTFREGLYRIHSLDEIEEWDMVVAREFPEFASKFACFANDWLGRQFALDLRRTEGSEPLTLAFDPGAAQAFQIPATFSSFHEEELVDYVDSTLAVSLFNSWRQQHSGNIGENQCVGYKVPLFLGGRDSLDNLEIWDLEVYWELCAQLRAQTRDLPNGTAIGKISIE